MTKEQAINLLSQVCSIYRGTLEEHKALQEALEVIKNLEEKKEKNSK
jgi:phosphoribosyl 1,2-cyclic phosphodiesterase